jgi:two-component sensor histidine kinase
MCPDKLTSKQFEQQLRRQELAMEEMNHRFRNELQIISNLLEIQAAKSFNSEVLDALRQCRARVGSIVAVHDILRPGSRAVRVDEYLRALVAALVAAWCGEDTSLSAEVKADSTELLPARAAVVGLLVTELVTNAFKHAFGPGQKGRVIVEFGEKKMELVLVVSDSGRGFASGDCVEKATGGGLRLVRSLVGQLRGQLKCSSAGGARIEIVFPV